MRVTVKLLGCSAPLWELSTSQRQLWRRADGTLMVSGQPVQAVDVIRDYLGIQAE